MMVLDTHVLIWWLSEPGQLSPAARRAIRRASAETPAIVSAISVLEIATAARRGRLVFSMPADQWLADARSLPELRFEPVSAEIAQMAGAFGESMHGDPADRVIAATALTLAAPLVTADSKLRSVQGLKTVW